MKFSFSLNEFDSYWPLPTAVIATNRGQRSHLDQTQTASRQMEIIAPRDE